ncbi:MAG: endolytic transglycosylase MltG [Schumannella sp.]|nr:endolytic transglycosylase MltG [Microbacteriaceae bacterium]
MPDENTNWDDIFGPAGAQPTRQATPEAPASVEPVSPQFPTARLSDPFAVAAAEATATAAVPIQSEVQIRPGQPPRGAGLVPSNRRDGGRRGSRGPGAPRSKRWIGWLVAVTAIFAMIGGAGIWAWTNHEDKVREILGWEIPNDFAGSGNGVEAIVIIQSGDIGSDVAKELYNKGVTMTFDATYNYLLANPEISFQPGNYSLQQEMSAESAVAALQNPANKILNSVTIPEGTAAVDVYALLASALELPVEDIQAAAKDYTSYGVPKEAHSIEGFLFPATYDFDPGTTAEEALQRLVSEAITRLDAAGVEPKDRVKTVILASIIQREAGQNSTDMAKIGRVFLNRLDQGMHLESDATVAYGTGNTHTVWTTDAERADKSNKWNTYANAGLPYGPIGNPGDAAIDGAIHPADGDWLFFVPINLKTGETVFSVTADEHYAAVEQLRAWCRASSENAAYCA